MRELGKCSLQAAEKLTLLLVPEMQAASDIKESLQDLAQSIKKASNNDFSDQTLVQVPLKFTKTGLLVGSTAASTSSGLGQGVAIAKTGLAATEKLYEELKLKVEYNENDLYDLITQCEEDAKAQATMGTIISESKEKGTYTVETTTGRLPIHKMQEQEQKVEQPV